MESNRTDKKFTVTGMTCSACSARVERCVGKIDGVSDVTVNLISGILSVSMDGDKTGEIKRAVKAEGYGIKEGVTHRRGGEEAQKLKKRLIISFPLLAVLMYVSMGHMIGMDLGVTIVPHFFHEYPLIFALTQLALCVPIMIVNRKYFIVGFKKLFTGAPNMDSLIAMGSAVSFIYSVYGTVRIAFAADFLETALYTQNLFYEGAAMILTFITIGKFLEEKSKNKTMSAVEKLLDLAPDTAVVLRDGEEVEIKSAELKAGDTVILKDGYSVPADGVVVSGSGWADESVITGESLPVYKEVGAKVVCGTRFTGGYMSFKAQNVGEDSTVFKIVKLVENANSTKVPIARVADRVSAVFVPSVIVIALIAFAAWLIATKDFATAIRVGVSVLVVSCPCALGLATPAALMAGTGKAAENGILVKSGEALQRLEKVNKVVLDKTGTITFGKPEVDVYEHIEALSEQNFLGICASLERKSSHVIGKPIIELAEEKNCPVFSVDGFETVAGEGIKGIVDGKICLIGNKKLLKESGVTVDVFEDKTKAVEEGGASVLYVAVNGQMCGYMSIKDKIKPSSYAAVDTFSDMGIGCVMLTGDSEAAASSAASELGIDYRAGVLPQDKYTEVKKLRDEGSVVMMVGDGVNDAPALTEADVGVAIGAGTDIAIESADVVLIKNDLQDAADAVRLGKKVMLNIKENLFWAFFYNVILIPVACGALVPLGLSFNPMYGSIAMSLSSIFVVGNALRLRFFKFGKKSK